VAKPARRRRSIEAHEAPVSCPGGRWGRRRTRVGECSYVLKAEDCYTALLRDDIDRVKPSARGEVTLTVSGHQLAAGWEIRPNHVWRNGRLFLICPRCLHRCTRLYLPLPTSWLACRKCWGLTYASRTLQNYKDSPFGRGRFARLFPTTQRAWSFMTTSKKRKLCLEASQARWEERKTLRESEASTGDMS
jgi:hypothetical protein